MSYLHATRCWRPAGLFWAQVPHHLRCPTERKPNHHQLRELRPPSLQTVLLKHATASKRHLATRPPVRLSGLYCIMWTSGSGLSVCSQSAAPHFRFLAPAPSRKSRVAAFLDTSPPGSRRASPTRRYAGDACGFVRLLLLMGRRVVSVPATRPRVA